MGVIVAVAMLHCTETLSLVQSGGFECHRSKQGLIYVSNPLRAFWLQRQ